MVWSFNRKPAPHIAPVTGQGLGGGGVRTRRLREGPGTPAGELGSVCRGRRTRKPKKMKLPDPSLASPLPRPWEQLQAYVCLMIRFCKICRSKLF